MRKFKVTLLNGNTVVSEFHGLANAEGYLSQVFTGTRPFSAWEYGTSITSPNGDVIQNRTRRYVNPASIAEVVEIDDQGNTISAPKGGKYKVFTAAEGQFRNVPAGTYLVHKEEGRGGRKYIILNHDNSDDDAVPEAERQAETRFFFESRTIEENSGATAAPVRQRRSSW